MSICSFTESCFFNIEWNHFYFIWMQYRQLHGSGTRSFVLRFSFYSVTIRVALSVDWLYYLWITPKDILPQIRSWVVLDENVRRSTNLYQLDWWPSATFIVSKRAHVYTFRSAVSFSYVLGSIEARCLCHTIRLLLRMGSNTKSGSRSFLVDLIELNRRHAYS